MSSAWEWIDDALDDLDRANLRRRLRTFEGRQGPTCRVDGREILNFASNDYLSLAGDPRLTEAAAKAAAVEGWGAGASPLIVGHRASHTALETRLAEFEGTEAALWFTSGYAANVGAVTALVERGDAVFSDTLNHASLVDGCRLSRAEVHIYPHCDVAALDGLLHATRQARRKLIVTDSLFSMDGDIAPLAAIAELAEKHNTMLLVDEAHATGVFGAQGRGLCEQTGVEESAIRMGTLSKALGGAGGFVCGPRTVIEWLVNRARTYVFSTAPPPAVAAAAVAALDIVASEPARRERLLANSARVRNELSFQGWNIGASTSQIIPLIIGDPKAAMGLTETLWDEGLFVPAIRPPSVPAGASRLRLCLTAGHDDAMLDRLIATLARFA